MKHLYFLVAALIGSATMNGNNLEVTNVSFNSQLPADDLIDVEFDVSWDNSWRVTAAPANHDAAWVFVKFRAGDGVWKHATIMGAKSVSNGTLELSGDQTGVFLYRNSTGTGSVNYRDVKLLWDYGADGVEDLDLVSVQVFAIEMVYVRAGAYTLSYSSDASAASLTQINDAGNALQFYSMQSEAAINVEGIAPGNMYYGGSANGGGDHLGPIPTAFPKGTIAFYSMKYETTQQQYADFYNTLTPQQKLNLNLTDAFGKNSNGEVNRNNFRIDGNGLATTTSPQLPINFVSPARAWAFLDWAALRPMSELEMEKAARGNAAGRSNGYPWGTTTISTNTLTMSGASSSTENFTNLSTGSGNAVYNNNYGVAGPARVGAIAGSTGANSRIRSGAGFYGVMDLAGNVYELLVSIGSPQGRTFTGSHGDGQLTTSGLNTGNPDWPTATAGYGVRGGGYSSSAVLLRLGDRRYMTYSTSTGIALIGFRGVRSAP